MFGSDPNWGRVLAAVGMSPFASIPHGSRCRSTVSRFVSKAPAHLAREVDLSGPDIDVTIDLALGDGRATIRTTDLSHAYVEENSAYGS